MSDLIYRHEAIRTITSYNGTVDKSVAKRLLLQMPSAQPRKKGKWIWYGDKHVCSVCDEFALCDAYDVLETGEYQEELSDYCPNCGADMREEPYQPKEEVL